MKHKHKFDAGLVCTVCGARQGDVLLAALREQKATIVRDVTVDDYTEQRIAGDEL